MTAAELVAWAVWGNEPPGVPRTDTVHPAFGEIAEGSPGVAPAPLSIALDPDGGVHALARGGDGTRSVAHFRNDGSVAGSTPLQTPPGTRVADFAVAAAGAVYALSVDGAGGAWVSATGGGREPWSRSLAAYGVRPDAGAAPPRLLLDGRSRPHVAVDDGRGTVLRLDAGGAVERTVHADAAGNRAFITPDGLLVFATYFPAAARRGVVTFDPADGRREERVGDDALHRWLTWPLGIDGHGHLYAWHLSDLARLGMDGSVEPLGRVDAAVARATDGAVFLAAGQGDEMIVQVHLPGAAVETRHIALPAGRAWRLAHAGDDGALYFAAEQPEMPTTVAKVLPGGERAATGGPELLPADARLQSPDSWRVDPAGRLYLPLLDDRGFGVLRLSFAAAPHIFTSGGE